MDCLLESFPEVRFRVETGRGGGDPDPGEAEVVFCWRVDGACIERAPALQWINVPSAGVDHLPLELIAERGIALTNGRGAHGIPVSETALAMMLAFSSGLPDYIAARAERRWVRPQVAPARFELEGQTLLVIGVGHVGSALARKARGIGMTVVGCDLRRSEGANGVHRWVALGELDWALAGADHVALCLPLTEQTRGIMGAQRIALMKPTAFLYNLGRGALVDQAAVIAALEQGKIAGAGLDTTLDEPIPQDDSIWSAPNIILTQHSAGASPMNSRRATDQFSENLHRYLNGYPLLNLVDPRQGY